MTAKISFLIACGCFLVLPASAATTNRVDQTGAPGTFRTIKDALVGLADGGVVEIGPGIYTESMLVQKSVLLRGRGPQYVVVRGLTTDPAVYDPIVIGVPGSSAPTVTLDGLTISSAFGNGVVIRPFSSAVVRNCVISDCAHVGILHDSAGNTLYDDSRVDLRVLNCTFANIGDWAVDCATRYGGYFQIEDCILYKCNAAQPKSMLLGSDAVDNNDVRLQVEIGRTVLNFGRGVWETRIGQCCGGSPTSSSHVIRDTAGIAMGSLDFVDEASGNYVLQPSSSAKDRGTPGAGAMELDGTASDCGAYSGPNAARFWPYPQNGPLVTSLSVSNAIVQQGGKITIRAAATTR